MRWFLMMALAGPVWCQVPQFTISTVVGNGLAGHSGDGGPAMNRLLILDEPFTGLDLLRRKSENCTI